MSDELSNYRKKIDRIDNKIVKLLSRRFSIAQDIGKIKMKASIDINDNLRERKIIERLSQLPNTTLSKDEIQLIYNNIFQISKETQKS